MKSAIYIEDGLFQVVLTPETEIEKTCLEKLSNNAQLEVHKGSFYECQGGWYRQGFMGDSSTIFVCRDQKVVSDASEKEGV